MMSMIDSSGNNPTTSGRLLTDEQLATWLDEIDVPDHNRLAGVREVLEVHIAAQARAARTLGRIVADQCRDVLAAIGGAPDLIDETGDGDWAVVWERLAELRPERDAALQRLAELHAQLDTNWAVRNRVTQFAARTVKALRTDVAVLQRDLDVAQGEWRKVVTNRPPSVEAQRGMQRKLRAQADRIQQLTEERNRARRQVFIEEALADERTRERDHARDIAVTFEQEIAARDELAEYPQRYVIGIDWTPDRIAALADDPGKLTVLPAEEATITLGPSAVLTGAHVKGAVAVIAHPDATFTGNVMETTAHTAVTLDEKTPDLTHTDDGRPILEATR